jgi:alkanesulfonate monooxygenase SsuD/methylene tetrahydromethanopterin reductase-like flavin-dependent oxidoreductase (luciferase family)
VALASHLHVATESAAARAAFYPHYAAYFRHHAPKTSYKTEVPRAEFDARAAPDGPLFVGSPQEIIDKIGYERELFGHQRFLAQIDIGGLPFAAIARMIELLARDVLPVVREM